MDMSGLFHGDGCHAEIDPRACRDLWCAVLMEQIELALSPKRADRKSEISAARGWLGSRDFFTICALANVDGAFVLWGVRRQLAHLGVA
ncbi:MAG: hypothetical protein H5U19_08195 [Rhodobacteraceae bacterium]|nr:hypothetical protein [Paracoccaceae bacterium]